MFGKRRPDPIPIVADPPVVVSDHAKELLEKSKETRQVLEQLLDGNHFTQSMKRSLGKKKRKR